VRMLAALSVDEVEEEIRGSLNADVEMVEAIQARGLLSVPACERSRSRLEQRQLALHAVDVHAMTTLHATSGPCGIPSRTGCSRSVCRIRSGWVAAAGMIILVPSNANRAVGDGDCTLGFRLPTAPWADDLTPKPTYWDPARKGLLSGEQLHFDLRRMDIAYLKSQAGLRDQRHVSLLQIDPVALIALRKTGRCEFSIPELLYDLDCPGHYMRRIKALFDEELRF
jgi:hypothetical protein